jgi:outer membrane protein
MIFNRPCHSSTVFDGGVQKRNVRLARAVRDATVANLRREAQALELRVIDAYVRVLRARHAIRVAQQKLESAQAQKEMVIARREAGTAAGVDVYPIEVQIANARVEKLGAEAELRASGSALRNAMGLEEGPVPEVAELPEKPAEPAPLEACIELARASRPEVIAAQADLERERAMVALARLKSRPQLETAARVDRGLAGSSINSQWLVYATLTWSLYDRSHREESAAGEARITALEARHRQLLKDVAAEVTQAYIALQGARARAEASEVSVAMARKSLEVAEARYQLGLAIPIELVDAQIARSTAELQAIQLRYDAFLSHARLRDAMGQEILIP